MNSLLCAGLIAVLLSCVSSWEPCSKENGYCGDGKGYYDTDGDGYDDPLYVGDDCDDLDASIYPGAPIVCDLAEYGAAPDRDCDGVDDHLSCDFDGDLLTPEAGDCDDLDAVVGQGFPEVCGDPAAKDNDCDGFADADDPDCVAGSGDTGDTGF